METINVTIPDGMKSFVQGQVAKGGYRGPDEYVQALIQAAYSASLEGQLLEGIDGLEKGDAAEMTSQEWEELRNEYKVRHAKGLAK